MPVIHIRGLVKLAGNVDQRLKGGLHPEEEPEFRAAVQAVIDEVNDICLRYQQRVDDLPTPSRRAYKYLVEVLAGELPRPRRRRQTKVQPPDERLIAIFERVNQEYFNGEIKQPCLSWSSRITRREFGSYNLATDRLVISRTLSSPETPSYVQDFIMYHELLHKRLGVRTENGRRRSHTPEFRRAEQAFRYYREAQVYIHRLVRRLA